MTTRSCERFWLLLLVTMATSACANSEEHPPFCYEDRCVPSVAVKVKVADAGTDGEVSGVAGAAATVTVNAQILEVNEFSSFTEASGTFNVTAPSANSALVRETVGSVFRLSGVLSSRVAWISATAVGQAGLMPGLVGFDATRAISSSSPIEIPLVRRSDLQVVANALISMTVLDENKAQVVMAFVNSKGQAVSGVSVQMAGGTTMARAYDLGAGYTDDASATSARGLAFLLNVDASATPARLTATLSGAVSGEIAVPVQAGAATMMGIVVSPG